MSPYIHLVVPYKILCHFVLYLGRKGRKDIERREEEGVCLLRKYTIKFILKVYFHIIYIFLEKWRCHSLTKGVTHLHGMHPKMFFIYFRGIINFPQGCMSTMVLKIITLLVGSYDFTILQLPTVSEKNQNWFLVGMTKIAVISRENGRIIVYVEKYRFF